VQNFPFFYFLIPVVEPNAAEAATVTHPHGSVLCIRIGCGGVEPAKRKAGDDAMMPSLQAAATI
jgi:hypothetical protein